MRVTASYGKSGRLQVVSALDSRDFDPTGRRNWVHATYPFTAVVGRLDAVNAGSYPLKGHEAISPSARERSAVADYSPKS